MSTICWEIFLKMHFFQQFVEKFADDTFVPWPIQPLSACCPTIALALNWRNRSTAKYLSFINWLTVRWILLPPFVRQKVLHKTSMMTYGVNKDEYSIIFLAFFSPRWKGQSVTHTVTLSDFHSVDVSGFSRSVCRQWQLATIVQIPNKSKEAMAGVVLPVLMLHLFLYWSGVHLFGWPCMQEAWKGPWKLEELNLYLFLISPCFQNMHRSLIKQAESWKGIVFQKKQNAI